MTAEFVRRDDRLGGVVNQIGWLLRLPPDTKTPPPHCAKHSRASPRRRGKVWTVGPRKVPPPLGASAESRQTIAATPQPDVKAVSSVSPKSASDWEKIIAPRNQAKTEANQKLAEAWSVRVEETTIADVPVFKVTPPSLDPALADMLFVHTLEAPIFITRVGRDCTKPF